ncbi:hypothetical protein OYC64_003131 [Pagothenia borchgrevinki]|uniref:Uncharacterized protein n=1 Tax=Pagothenia borchgrevinki TaxID=8213 RepID=A0ABD2HC10_PAGBO
MLSKCLLCGKFYKGLNLHLKRNHMVLNIEERSILLKMANGRITIRTQPCNLSGCDYHGTRLDRHLVKEHKELSQKEAGVALRNIKHKVGLQMLRDLRRRNPEIGMISTLDEDDGTLEEWGQIDTLKREVKSLRCKLQRVLKRKRQRTKEKAVSIGGEEEQEQEHVYIKEPNKDATPSSSRSRNQIPLFSNTPVASCSRTPPVPSCSTPNSLASCLNKPKAARKTPAGETSSPTFSPWSSGWGQGNIMRRITLPNIIEEYLTAYREHHEGIAPNIRQSEKAQSKVSRVMTFLMYMAHGNTRLSDWVFINDVKRIRGYSQSTIKSGKAVTTADLKNVAQFVKYMMDTPCRGSRLTMPEMRTIRREVKAGLNALKKPVLLHQIWVKRTKNRGSAEPDGHH